MRTPLINLLLGTGMDTQDTSLSVLLFFDKQRFIFNAGEGLQRFCSEHKIKGSFGSDSGYARITSRKKHLPCASPYNHFK